MTQDARASDWQANSRSGLSRSPCMMIHDTYGVPGATPEAVGIFAPHAPHAAASAIAGIVSIRGRISPRPFITFSDLYDSARAAQRQSSVLMMSAELSL